MNAREFSGAAPSPKIRTFRDGGVSVRGFSNSASTAPPYPQLTTGSHLTAPELARRIRRPVGLVEAVMLDCERLGVVERVGDGFRLTVRTERRYGRALRQIGDEP